MFVVHKISAATHALLEPRLADDTGLQNAAQVGQRADGVRAQASYSRDRCFATLRQNKRMSLPEEEHAQHGDANADSEHAVVVVVIGPEEDDVGPQWKRAEE